MSESGLLKTIERAQAVKDFCDEYNGDVRSSLWGNHILDGRVKDLTLLQWIIDNPSLIQTAQRLAK